MRQIELGLIKHGSAHKLETFLLQVDYIYACNSELRKSSLK